MLELIMLNSQLVIKTLKMETDFLNRQRPKRNIICKRCKKDRLNHAKGLCGTCYTRKKYEKKVVESFIF